MDSTSPGSFSSVPPRAESSGDSGSFTERTGLPGSGRLIEALNGASAAALSGFSPLLLETARQVVWATDRALGETWNSNEITEKSVGDFVTALDLSLDRHVCRALEALHGCTIVSEEGDSLPDLHALDEAWILDPLDGTTASLRGELHLCGPMVALLERGEPVFSVMLTLDGSTLALAERSKGAALWKCTPGLPGSWVNESLREADSPALKQGCVLFNPQSDRTRSHPAFSRLHQSMSAGTHAMAIESRVPHSMAALGLGRNRRVAVVHDNCPEYTKQMAWDVLPVQLWVQERGGVYWGIDGAPYDIRRPMPIIAAGSAEIARALVELSQDGA